MNHQGTALTLCDKSPGKKSRSKWKSTLLLRSNTGLRESDNRKEMIRVEANTGRRYMYTELSFYAVENPPVFQKFNSEQILEALRKFFAEISGVFFSHKAEAYGRVKLLV